MRAVRGFSSQHAAPIVMCALFLAGSALSQKRNDPTIPYAPTAVTGNLHTIFPNAVTSKTDAFERNGGVFYRIGIVDGGHEREVVFSADGAISEVVDSIGFTALPLPVKNALSRNYPSARIVKTDKKTTGAGYEYLIEAVVGKDTVELNFTNASMVVSSKRCSKTERLEKSSGLARN